MERHRLTFQGILAHHRRKKGEQQMTIKTTSRIERFILMALCLAFVLGVAATAEAGEGDAAASPATRWS